MLVLAHRGCHGDVPENTLPAFEAAAARNVDGIETDVRVSRDGLPVLVHDRVVTGIPVSALTRAEVERRLGHEVPTLEEALHAFPDLYWNVEIKTRAAVAPTLKILERQRGERRLVTSFRHDAAAVIASRIDVDCGWLIAERPFSLEALFDAGSPLERLRTLVCDFEIMDADLVDAARAHGWRIWAYGLKTQDEHVACAGLGLDGIITDHLELGLEVR